ncbi:hypothetical protein [Streptomyces alfalfae]|uniref:Uncharacterized protein n=1 Tax=Streptomyces alfalfae TaxID=1642299 RepID=A0A7T4PGI0_9ACTN|nr:hypothetical protein [Streptomyces alfalfae]QQC89828.1 hypothetical protein I8755_16470 [Streptomyces alfalfae]
MARVRFIGPEPVTVPELGGRAVEPDEVVEVPDDRYEGYVCQPQTWEPVEEPRTVEELPPVEESQAAPAPLSVRKSAPRARKEV